MSASANRTTILIVEPKSEHEPVLRSCLERLGYYLSGPPASLEHAFQLAVNQLPDLVLLGPGGAGRQAVGDSARALRDAWNRPVLLLSDVSEPDVIPELGGLTDTFPLLVFPCTDRELHSNIQTAISRHAAEQTLLQQRDWLHSNLQFLADAVVVTDEVGRLRSLNLAAERLTGWSQAEASGRFASTVLSLLDPVTRLPLNPIEDALGGDASHLR